MTAVAEPTLTYGQYQVLKAYAAGNDIDAVARSTGQRRDVVSHIVLTLASCNRSTARVACDRYVARLRDAARRPFHTPAAPGPAPSMPNPEVRHAATDLPDGPAPVVDPAPETPPTPPAMDVAVAGWPGWRCDLCGGTYRHPYRDHGAPDPCRGRLEPVTVGGTP